MSTRTNTRGNRQDAACAEGRFLPLASSSQMMRDTNVMYFDAGMSGSEIHEQAQYRISIAQQMLESYASSVFKAEDERLGQALASVSALLISDAMALVNEMGRRVSGKDQPAARSGGSVVSSIHSSKPDDKPRPL